MRPDAQLFFHVLGAASLFGGVAVLAALGFAGRRSAHGPALARAGLLTTLAVAVPAWALTVVFGSWAKSREGIPGSVEWLRIGNGIASGGIVALLAEAALAYAWTRRPDDRRLPVALLAVATAYLGALGVAWWVMTAKVPS